MELLDENMQRWAASLDRHGDPVQAHLIEIAEHQIDDPDDRKFFNNVPTSLSLDDETVDRLIEIGRRLLRESPDFKNLVSQLQP
jgi:NTE family protein